MFGQNPQIHYSTCNCASNLDIRYYKISHYHKIKDHARFGAKTKIADLCATAEFPGEINVVADGTTSSMIDIDGVTGTCFNIDNIDMVILDEDGNEIGNTMPDTYGAFNFLWSNGDKFAFEFKHPTLIPGNGRAYDSLYVGIKSNQAIASLLMVKYYRPPIVMIHGLWSNEGAFTDMKDQFVSSGNYFDSQIYKADYSGTNDKSFSTNFLVTPKAIGQVLFELSMRNNLAGGKVDVVSHSMGGILTRRYLNNPLYQSNKDIRRVITCNTPHAGSQMANFLLDPTQYGTTVASLLNLAGMNCNAGAVSDLRVGTPRIDEVAYGSILGDAKVHAIRTQADISATILSSNASKVNLSTMIMSLLINHCATNFLTDVFDSPYHDAIVTAASQDGGLSGLNLSAYLNQVHMGSVANGNVMNRVADLLNYAEPSSFFTNAYTGLSLSYTLDVPCLPFRDDKKYDSRAIADVEITNPLSGSNINSGGNLTINYTTSMVDSVIAMLSFHPDSVAIVANSGNAGSLILPIPPQVYGAKSLVLIGMDVNNKIVDIDSVMVNFTTNATLDSISIYPGAFYLNQGDTMSFTLSGHFSDGFIRNVTLDTTFIFDFELDNASKLDQYNLKMDSLANDTLYISKGSIISDTILINKVGTNFPGNCHIVSNTNNDGNGSLRQALLCATQNDTISFDILLVGDTIFLDSIPLDIENTVTVINAHAQKIIIKSAANGIFNIFAGTQVWLENLMLISANPSHICINSFGDLTIKNIECKTTGTGNALILNQLNGTIQMLGTNVVK